MMKRWVIRAVALLLLLAAVFAWIGMGANRGWTKTTVPVKSVDEVTGIEGITYKKQFVPGVDFLAAAAGFSVVLFGISICLRK